MPTPRPTEKKDAQILTVSVEDYFHTGSFEGVVRQKHWARFESHLEQNIQHVLDMLSQRSTKATFFVLGWIAEHQPEIVRMIADAGHEIASRCYWPRGVSGMVPEEFRQELLRSREALEKAGANRIFGFRSARWLRPDDLWILDILAEEGYLYDSSINPVGRRFAAEPERWEVHEHRHKSKNLTLQEIPVSTMSLGGLRISIAGGNYIRQLPHALLERMTERWIRTRSSPLVSYFMPWEFDWNQPRIAAVSRLNQIRHYRNLAKTRWVIEQYTAKYRFQPIGDYLELPWRVWADGQPDANAASRPRESPSAEIFTENEATQPITIVVPLFNESPGVQFLESALSELRKQLAPRYHTHFVLVDDGSSDDTWSRLGLQFREMPDCKYVRHEKNRGVAAAIMTGILAATTEIVCSMDCDCSYEPGEFETMLPKIEEADLVTASPYHPQGLVRNVPSWRLVLSRTLSRMYSLLLRERFHTYTSCFRVYRRSAVEKIQLDNAGFLGVAELLIRLKLDNKRIVEHPATLESRLLGESKMKVVRTIGSHLGLLRQLALGRTGLGPLSEGMARIRRRRVG